MPDRVSACGGDLFGGMREALEKKKRRREESQRWRANAIPWSATGDRQSYSNALRTRHPRRAVSQCHLWQSRRMSSPVVTSKPQLILAHSCMVNSHLFCNGIIGGCALGLSVDAPIMLRWYHDVGTKPTSCLADQERRSGYKESPLTPEGQCSPFQLI